MFVATEIVAVVNGGVFKNVLDVPLSVARDSVVPAVESSVRSFTGKKKKNPENEGNADNGPIKPANETDNGGNGDGKSIRIAGVR